LFFLISIYHVLLLILRDRRYIVILRSYNKDPEDISINDLKELPLVNIIVPAWKEGEYFRDCLILITQLSYPKLKVIINAGGSKETIEIANSYKMNKNFTVLHQDVGGGKIKAINDCLEYISEGVIFFN